MWTRTCAYAIPRGRGDGVPSLSASTSREKSEVPKLSGEEGAKQSNEMAPAAFRSIISCRMGHWGQNSNSGLMKWVKLAISASEAKRGGEQLQLSLRQVSVARSLCHPVPVPAAVDMSWFSRGSHGFGFWEACRGGYGSNCHAWQQEKGSGPHPSCWQGAPDQLLWHYNPSACMAFTSPSLPCHTEHADFLSLPVSWGGEVGFGFSKTWLSKCR